ncbi:related to Mitochondrial import inner membrane translocase subunit TIM54 [Zygosaccharomyces bailii ISA1307]|nr:related to Mitochondrial import inner membrane translocase subunit TIM54 [Zygosaccharomyces bailii ISA1307]
METKKEAKPGYTNPAFKAMGIPALRLPSRNWTIFWTILTASIGGIVYDKYQQKQIRNHYREIVEPLSRQLLGIDRQPRKVTVFVAPPPSDYLETSMKVWKRYVKPILYWGGLDYELIEADSQGVIRHEVARRIREVRKQLLEAQTADEKEHMKISKSKKTENDGLEEEEQFDPEQAKQFKENFDYSKALGVFRQWNAPKLVYEDSLVEDPALSGGVICLGRGAYKEYINGLHEGMLGPLEPPEEPKEPGQEEKRGLETKSISEDATNLKDVNESTSTVAAQAASNSDVSEKQSMDSQEDDQAGESGENNEGSDDKEKKQVPKPYIVADDYSKMNYPRELEGTVRDPKTKVPILPHQSILAIPIPNLIGFLCIPERIARFYTKRYYAEEVMSAVTHLVLQEDVRPFEDPKDLDLCKEEELDWPKKWVQRGLDRNSEWTSQFKDDPRVAEQLHVYNKKRQDEDV